jgi:hypothetical protein
MFFLVDECGSPLVRQSEPGPGRNCAAHRRSEVRIRDGQREDAGRSYPPLLTSVPQVLMIVMRLLQSPVRRPRSSPRRRPFDGCARVAGGPERGSGSGGSAGAAEADICASGEGQISRRDPETSFRTRPKACRALTTLRRVHQKQRHSGPLKRHIRFYLSTGLSIRTSLLPGERCLPSTKGSWRDPHLASCPMRQIPSLVSCERDQNRSPRRFVPLVRRLVRQTLNSASSAAAMRQNKN